MIYLNNDGTDYITSDNFVNCGNEQRDELSKVYHLPNGRELYNFLDNLDSWDDIPANVFQQLAVACGVDYDAEAEADELMERCEKALTKYRVLPEYIDLWYGNSPMEDIELKQKEGWTYNEIKDLARDWEKDEAELLEQLEEI